MNDFPLRAASLQFQEADGDVLVHDAVRKKIHVLNATAARVLEACDGQTSLVEISERIACGNPARAYSDVLHIIEEFRRLGLIEA